MQINLLTINPTKSNVMVISLKSNSSAMDLTVKIVNSILTFNDSAKYLGIEIDTKLNFYNHIKTIKTQTVPGYWNNL